MKKIYLVLALIIASLAAATEAAPISYDIIFTTIGPGLPPTSGVFTYDAAAPSNSGFTAFTVQYNGLTLDFTDAANNHESLGGCPGDHNGSATSFAILTGTIDCGAANTTRDFTLFEGVTAEFEACGSAMVGCTQIQMPFPAPVMSLTNGTFTVAPILTPEPGTLPVFLIGASILSSVKRHWLR